ncbi:hypothetical protein [Spiroplasma melliferum]|uniref:hypothetical protein n=1 Tax=Spiroplasma melliferum TaxID=2134 RepID=UPI000C772276|nr:hypothetical protein [Spiroplasma melliferum]
MIDNKNITIKNDNGTYWQRLGFEKRNPSQSFKAWKNRKFLKYDKYPFHIKKAHIMRYNAMSILYHTPFLSLYGLFFTSLHFNWIPSLEPVKEFMFGQHNITDGGFFGYTGIVISYPILHGTAWLTTKIPKIPAIKLPVGKCLEQIYKTPSYALYLILFGWLIFRNYLKKHNVNICHNCKQTEEQLESWNQYCIKKRWNNV